VIDEILTPGSFWMDTQLPTDMAVASTRPPTKACARVVGTPIAHVDIAGDHCGESERRALKLDQFDIQAFALIEA